MIITDATLTPPYVALRRNGKNETVLWQESQPSAPYLAIRLGGKTLYNPLIGYTSASRFPYLQIRKDNNLTSESILCPTKLSSTNDYGNGSSQFNSYFDVDYGGTFYPTCANWGLPPGYDSEDDVPPYDPREWAPTTTTVDWSLDIAAQVVYDPDYYSPREIYILDDTATEIEIDRNYGHKERYYFSCFNEGDSILLHHSEAKTESYDPARAGKWEVRKDICVPDYFGGKTVCRLILDKAPDLDLENFYVQAVPFVDFSTLSICNGLNIYPKPYSFEDDYTHCGGIVAIRCSGTFPRGSGFDPTSLPRYGLEFTGGHIICQSPPPFGDSVFIYAHDVITYDEFYENQTAPYNQPIIYQP